MHPDDRPPENVAPSDDPAAGDPAAGDHGRPLIVRSEDVLQDRREVWIEHNGQMYRLRVTARDKLYLTK